MGLGELKGVMTQLAQKKPASVVLKVRRGIHTMFLEIKPDWGESEK